MATEIVGSNLKALNGYGQNGYTGPSSSTPGSDVGKSGFLPACEVPSEKWQTRNVGPNVPTHPGMKDVTKGSV